MKIKFLVALCISMLLLATTASAAHYAFDFTFVSAETEKEEPFSQYEGKPVLIDLFATWCEPCKVEILHIKEINEQVGDQVEVLSISIDPETDTLPKIRDFRDQFEADWLFGLDQDGELKEIYNVSELPYLLLLDGSGEIVKQWVGITQTSLVYAELRSEFGIEVDNPEGEGEVNILVSSLLSNSVFRITATLTVLMIAYIIISNLLNREPDQPNSTSSEG